MASYWLAAASHRGELGPVGMTERAVIIQQQLPELFYNTNNYI
jgi:hypothetical protein